MRSVRRAIAWTTALAALVGAVRAQPVVAAFERFHRDAAARPERAVDGGQLLLNELNCVACHDAPAGWRERVPGRGKISLRGVGSRLDAEALRAFLHEPPALKPGTTMPAAVRADAAAAGAIAAYLGSLLTEQKTFPAGDAARGRKVYETVGCAACHAVEGGTSGAVSVPIGLARRYDRDALVAFLLDPLHTRPAGRMPATELSAREAADVAAYLQAGGRTAGRSAVSVTRNDPAAVARGRAEFAARNCVACHETDGTESVRVSAAKSLSVVDVDRGCLAEKPRPEVPDFALDSAQRNALRGAVRAMQARPEPVALTTEQRVAETFERLNCYACHEWRGRGGPAPARAALFAAADAGETLGELGRLPPKLDQAGRKLTPAWLEKILWGKGGGVRPYLATRMPKFGPQAAGGLVKLLAEACRPERPEEIDVSGTKGHQRSETGRALIGTGEGGLGCVACHGLRNRDPSGVRAINLTHTAERVRPEYFKALLLDPQGVQPGTLMPPLLAGRKNAAREIESLWTYLKEIDQNPRLPEGLIVADSFELKPETEGRPMVFRTFLRGAGTHAIAVGFPARVHVAFDAFEVRWAIAWNGRFLDALSNWEERSMPPISPLGENVRTFGAHMPLARLQSATESWPTACGTDLGYVMKGYRLAPDGVPTFRYTVGGLEVEDTIRPDGTEGRLRRIVRVRGDGSGWYFRGLSSDAAIRPVVWTEGVAVFEETL